MLIMKFTMIIMIIIRVIVNEVDRHCNDHYDNVAVISNVAVINDHYNCNGVAVVISIAVSVAAAMIMFMIVMWTICVPGVRSQEALRCIRLSQCCERRFFFLDRSSQRRPRITKIVLPSVRSLDATRNAQSAPGICYFPDFS